MTLFSERVILLTTYLYVEEQPIDCKSCCGNIIAVGNPNEKVSAHYAQRRAHFGIYAGWNENVTYIASKN
jgi:hypothetical protein